VTLGDRSLKMNIEERVRQIVLSEERSAAEKQKRLCALIPTDTRTLKIKDLTKATPEQLEQLKVGLVVAEALQQLNAELIRKREKGE